MILQNYLKRAMPSLSSVVFVLVWFAIAPLVRAVVPAPDGGYPGFNTAEGQNALFNLTTGVGNTAVGWFSLWSDTDGSYNTAVGAGTLLFNVGNQSTGEGAQNTAIGTAALLNNTTGSFNTATGTTALVNNTEGVGNTAVGGSALYSNITGINNTAVGHIALFTNNGDPSFGEGSFNCAFGAYALSAIPLAITTASSVRLHFNLTLPAKPIRPSVIVRSEAIPPPVSTRRLVFTHSAATPLVAKTRPTVGLRWVAHRSNTARRCR